VLRVRLIAPLEQRVRNVQRRDHVDADEARRHIHAVDQQRIGWTRFLYGVDWQDPSLYDLVINLERLDVESACGVVRAAATSKTFTADDASRKVMGDLLLASRIRADLAAGDDTAHADVEVCADSGHVRIQGKLRDPMVVNAVIAKAKAVPGVAAVDYGTRVMLEAEDKGCCA
jgi:Cytidylate kinase-like family/BON domain